MLFLALFLNIFPSHVLDGELLDVSFNSFLTQDSKGYVWISSSHGWNKYNGVTNTTYPYKYTIGIDGVWVQSNMYESNDAKLFTTTYEHLVIYDMEKDIFRSQKILFQGDTLQSMYHISSIDTLAGELYFTADKKLFTLNYNTWQCNLISKDMYSRRFLVDKEADRIVGCPWAENSGIELFEKQNDSWVRTTQLEEISYNGMNYSPIISQAVKHGNQYIFASNLGLIIWDIKNGKYQLYTYSISSRYAINYIVKNKGHLLVSLDKAGIQKFDLDQLSFVEDSLIEHLNEQLISDSPVEINLFENQMWASHRGQGVQMLRMDLEDLESKSMIYLEDERIRKLLKYDENELIVATEEGLIHLINLKNDLTVSYSPIDLLLTNPNIQDIAIDPEGTIWVADIYGISYKKIHLDTWTKHKRLAGRQFYFFNTDKDGDLMYTTSEGSYRITCSNNVFKSERLEDGYGVRSFALDDLHLTNYKNNLIIKDGNTKDTVFNIGLVYQFQLFNGRIYLATDSGIYHYENNVLEKTFSEIGFPVFSVSPIEQKLWFNSANEVYVYDLETDFLSRVPISSEFKFLKSQIVCHEEGVFIGTKQGLLKIPRESENYNFPIPKVIISDIVVDGISQDTSQAIVLRHDSKEIKINWDVIDFLSNRTSEVQFKLEGYDLNYQSTTEPITYFNLRPGNYKLSISTMDYSHSDSEQFNFVIMVRPPFYETLYFKIIVSLGLFLIGYLVNKIKSKRIIREQQIALDKQKALLDLRTSFSHDLHDEMGSGLASIKAISQQASNSTSSNHINAISKDLLSSMRDLIWSLDNENTSIESLVHKLRYNCNKQLKGTGIVLNFSADVPDGKLQSSAMLRRNLLLISKEALANVIKHSSAEHVEVNFKSENSKFSLSIRDNGKGITSRDNNGVGIVSMQRRTAQLSANLVMSSKSGHTTLIITGPILPK